LAVEYWAFEWLNGWMVELSNWLPFLPPGTGEIFIEAGNTKWHHENGWQQGEKAFKSLLKVLF